MKLSTNIKTHVVIFEDTSRPMWFITEDRFNRLRSALYNTDVMMIDLVDDDGNHMETIKKREIRGLRKIKDTDYTSDPTDFEKRWVCGYGTQHTLTEKCSCGKK